MAISHGCRVAVVRRLLFALLAAATLVPPPASPAEPAPAEILREYVLRSRPWADAEVRNLSLSADPPGGAPRRIVVAKGLPGRTVFSMEYGGGRTVTATADVVAFEEVVVSAHSLPKDRLLAGEDVGLARMEVGRIPPGAARDPQAVIGKYTTRSIGANQPLAEGSLAGSALVKRGQKVTLLVEGRGVRIAATGETRENAYVNTAVKAVNTASKKTVTGILVDENTVRVGY